MANKGHWREREMWMRIRRNFSHASVLKGQHCLLHKTLFGGSATASAGRAPAQSACGSGPPLNLWPLWGEVEGTKTVGSWLTICPWARTGKEIKQNKTKHVPSASPINSSAAQRKARYRPKQETARPAQLHFVKEWFGLSAQHGPRNCRNEMGPRRGHRHD